MKKSIVCIIMILLMIIFFPVPWNSISVKGEVIEGKIIVENITADTTWTKDESPYIINTDIWIVNNSILSVQPGTIIEFMSSSTIWCGHSSVTSKGHIQSIGTSDEVITYRSGDGQGGKIIFNMESIFYFQFCDFYDIYGIVLMGTDVSEIRNCNFHNTSGVSIVNPGVNSPDSTPEGNIVASSNFIGNSIGIRISGKNNMIYRNNFINNTFPTLFDESYYINSTWNDTRGQGNYWADYNGIDLDNDGIGDTNLPWHEVDWCPLMDPSAAINDCDQSWLEEPPDYDPNDKDGEGLPDIWEKVHGLDPTDPTDAFEDPDYDRLSNTAEYENNTDPMSDDTDGDHIKDKWEIENGLDPTNPADANEDVDNDGLSNIAEIWNNTDPFSNDTDGDGMPDGWEIINGLDPLNASDAQLDFDNDGLRNLLEYEAGTDPNNPKSTPLDRDGDGVLNTEDAYPSDPNRWEKEVVSTVGSTGWWMAGVVIALVVLGIIVSAVVVLGDRKSKQDANEDVNESDKELGRVKRG